MSYGGAQTDLQLMEAGSPQGSAISPFFSLLLVADMSEWIQNEKVRTVVYADDTSVYCCGSSAVEVRECLEEAAVQVLSFMSATGMAANPEKTGFLMFERGELSEIKVSEATVQEKSHEKMLGFTVV